MEVSRWQLLRGRVRRTVAARRRPLAAVTAAAAVLAAVQAARPAPAPTTPAVMVARDLPAGTVLESDDVRVSDVPADLLPDGAVPPDAVPVGRSVAAPLRTGEVLTDLSVVAPTGLQAHPSGTVLATVRVTDPAATDTVDVGDRVSVIGADLRSTGGAQVVARAVLVVALPGGADPAAGLSEGAPVVLAVDEATALALAEATVDSALSLVVTG